MTRDAYLAAVAEKGYQSAVEKTWAPGLFNDSHTHDFALFLFVTEGEIALGIVGDGGALSKPCRLGDSIEVAAGATHTERVGPAGVTFLVARK